MNDNITAISLAGIDPKKIERYRDFMNYYSGEPVPKEDEKEVKEDFNNVMRMLKNG